MVADTMVVALDRFYYLANFQAMLDTLLARDGDLLQGDELEFMRLFASLPQPARALLVRMVMRKGPLFRSSRLVYEEIGNVADATRPLVALGWLDDRPRLSVDELFRLMSKTELVRLGVVAPHRGALPQAGTPTKLDWLEDRRREWPTARLFEEWCAPSGDVVYRVTVDSLCQRLRLLFFGNFRQDLKAFVLADLGVFRYEKVVLQRESRPFGCRRHIDAFLRLHRCRELLHGGAQPAEVEALMPESSFDCEWLEERHQRLRFQIARAHERAGAIPRALAIFSTCTHREAAARCARLLTQQRRIARRRVRHAPVPSFELTMARPTERAVEHVVRDHLASADPEAAAPGGATSVHYVENGLVNSLFGLLCWCAIFAPVPGAFFHPFQRAPADLASPGFFARREREFAACLDELECGRYQETIRRRFVDKAGISSPFVAWGLLNEPLLDAALTCFPATHLRRWFEWIVSDVVVNRTGFPDLVQFWPQSARYRLIEVKGPGDRLQDNQRRCLDFCLSHEMPVAVCHVRYSGVPFEEER
jgi:hypothetical protein